MGIIKFFDIKNLLAFHKPVKGMPNGAGGVEEKIAELDPNLSPEEQVYVGHYVGYADILLGTDGPEEKVIEIPAQTIQELGDAKKTDSEAA